jgi:hypothetical protein
MRALVPVSEDRTFVLQTHAILVIHSQEENWFPSCQYDPICVDLRPGFLRKFNTWFKSGVR